jgi:transposase
VDALEDTNVRFLALDVHKAYIVAAAVNQGQQIVFGPQRIAMERLEIWSQKTLRPTDVVVLEAMSNTWDLYDQLSPLVAAVVVANPARVALIAKSRVKTDPADALALARLLAAGMLPTVWVPPVEVRELRGLTAHRQRLVWQRTQIRNRLRAVLLRHNIVAPSGDVFAPTYRNWWLELPLSRTEQLRVRQDLAMLDALSPLMAEADAEIVRLSQQEPWADKAAFVLQLPGVGVLSAMVILGAVGDIHRFDTDRQLVGYAGLGASVHHSGQTHHGGRITKQGRRELRVAMVEVAWSAVRWHPAWKATFERLSVRLGPNKAIVAIARKLLVVIWHVLHQREPDRQALPDMVSRKFVIWAYKMGRKERAGRTVGAFVRAELDRVGIESYSPTVTRGRHTIHLAAPPQPSAARTG